MTVLFHSPYGAKNPETGLLYLTANFLRAKGVNCAQLQCTGSFSVCDRDANRNWQRTVASCLSCMREQRQFAQWSGIPTAALSMYLTPDVIESTSRWTAELGATDLRSGQWAGVELFPLVRAIFHTRFGADPDPNNKSHDRFLRNLLLWAARFVAVLPEVETHLHPEVFCVPAGSDVFSLGLQHWSSATGRRCAVFRADFAKRSVCITLRNEAAEYQCPLLIEDLTSLRNDPATWTGELGTILSEVAGFLRISTVQMAEAV